MLFKKGEKVVCIDDSHLESYSPAVKGKTYIVKESCQAPNYESSLELVRVEGIDYYFDVKRFERFKVSYF